MSQIQEQIQTQQQVMQQRLTPQQMLVVHLIEMPLNEFEDNVRKEVDENPSLESTMESDDIPNSYENDKFSDGEDNYGSTDFETEKNREDHQDALNEALENMGADDAMEEGSSDVFRVASQALPEDKRQMEDGDTTSFLDTLYEQMNMEELTPRQRNIMEYLIGSLDDDGLLRKSIAQISDELAIYHNIDVPEEEIKKVLEILQTFDPVGVGAQSLQQCLILQLEKREDSPTKSLLMTILSTYFDDFINNRKRVLQQRLGLKDYQMQDLRRMTEKLNPKPGSSFGEAEGRSMQQITPDFIVHVDYDGRISFELNNGRVPKLHVAAEDEDFLKDYQNRKKLNKEDRKAIEFTQNNVNKAHSYIEAIKQRQRTLTLTMKAIIDIQRRYFLDGDDADLKPMILKDVADRTKLDISTISRVCRAKYAQTPWGTYKLRHFFSDAYTTQDGHILATKAIKVTLKDIINAEDKEHPLSDEKLVPKMKEKGFPIARRTIAKYREQMRIPTARLRKR